MATGHRNRVGMTEQRTPSLVPQAPARCDGDERNPVDASTDELLLMSAGRYRRFECQMPQTYAIHTIPRTTHDIWCPHACGGQTSALAQQLWFPRKCSIGETFDCHEFDAHTGAVHRSAPQRGMGVY
jgi:hypothetical protein